MAFDDWCTPPAALDEVAAITGLCDYDLDPASNAASLVPCRVALVRPPAAARALRQSERRRAVALETIGHCPVAAGGGLRVAADGCFPWPATARVWCNPPYSRIRPWVERILDHAQAGGEGAAVLPLLLDSRWAHALLEARVDIGRARELLEMERVAAGDPRQSTFRTDAPLHLWVWRGRLSFLDPRRGGAPGLNSRGGSLLVTWGREPLSTVREAVTCL